MNKLPPQHWHHDGQTFSVCLFVEGSTVVGITEVHTTAGVVVPPEKFLGDHLASGMAKLGVAPCKGCNKRKDLLNNVHRGAKKLVGLS